MLCRAKNPLQVDHNGWNPRSPTYSPSAVTFNHPISIIMDDCNSLVAPTDSSHKSRSQLVMVHISQQSSCQNKNREDESNDQISDDYLLREQQNQLLLSSLLSSMSDSFLRKMEGSNSVGWSGSRSNCFSRLKQKLKCSSSNLSSDLPLNGFTWSQCTFFE